MQLISLHTVHGAAPRLNRRITAYLRVITQAMSEHAHAHVRTKVLHARHEEIQSCPRTRRRKKRRLVPPPEMWD